MPFIHCEVLFILKPQHLCLFTEELGLTQLDYYNYLKGGGGGKSANHHKVDGTDDVRDFKETVKGNFAFEKLSV